ncbi:hypothetical protein EZV62_005120 [Acer yangbiense]|uniref:PROP1-like PPR domain-containing protein n=1 Tax=Acer yangbiense TaxID=1000413 RepID=A0A5C7ILW7_9ROSI|nr:hypothetical protein EZV62_005120 [Acer yangbiense]
MRYLTRLQSLCSNSQHSRLKISHLSSFSKSSKPLQPKKTNKPPLNSQTSYIASLFSDITDILSVDNATPDKIPSGFIISSESHLKTPQVGEALHSCPQHVRTNVSKDEPDISPVVHQITEIVRAEKGVVSMEERLENSGFLFEPKVVEKVLKRCFKVPHSALMFFSCVKLRQEFYHTTETYNTMLCIAGELRDFGLMEELERDMEINSCEKDIKTWTILVSQYGKAKLIAKAFKVFDKMKKCGFEPDVVAYRLMVRLLFNAGNGDIAFEFYKEMAQKEMALDLNLYRMVLNYVARLGNVDDVHSIVDDMMKIAQIPEYDVYSCMLKSFCVAGRIREALALTQDLKNKEIPIDVNYFETLVKGLCMAGRIEDALEIVDIMNRRDLVNGKVYGIIINGYLRKKDLLKALAMFQRMKETGYSPMASTYTELMQHLFKFKEFQKGCELYYEMLERGIQPDSVAITAMAAGHVRRNDISKAWKVFKSMEDIGIRPTWKSYSIFIKELCRVSRTDWIFKVLNEMQASKIVIGDEIFHWVITCMEKKGEKDDVESVKKMHRTCKTYSQEGEEESSNDASRRRES